MSKQFEKYFKIILGIYQIIGGLYGLYLVFSSGLSSFLSHFLIYVFILGFFSFSIYCGLLLLISKTNGYKLTLINQYLQTIRIIIVGFGFEFYTGIISYFGFTDTPSLKFSFKTEFTFTSKAYLYIGNGNYEVSLAINLIPVLIIILINRLRIQK